MSAKYISSNWRLLNQENSSKSDNYGLSFNGNNEYIDTGDAFTSLTSFSILAWFKSDDTVSDNQAIVSSRINSISSSKGVDIFVKANELHARVYNNGATEVTTAFTDTASWHQVVITYNGTTLELFLDNVSQGTATGVYTNSAANWLIGKWNNGANYFNGSISEVAVFDYALSSTQISTLYGSSSLGAGNPMALKPQPVAYYPLGDNSASNPLTQPNEAVEDASVFEFDGSSSYVSTTITQSGTLSVSCWFYTDDASTQMAFFGAGTTYPYQIRNFGLQNGEYVVGVYTKDLTPNFQGIRNDTTAGSASYTTGQWTHFVGIIEKVTDTNANYYLYENGVLKVQTNDGYREQTTYPFFLGSHNNFGTATQKFNGKMSNIQLWSSKLETSDVTTLYNNGVPLLTGTQPQASNLKAWYKLDQSANWEADSSGNWTIPDASSNGNDGTSSGMTSANLVLSDLTKAVPFDSYSFSFDGANDYFATSQIDLGSTNSISFWINNTSGSSGTLFGDRNTKPSAPYALVWNPTTNKFFFRLGNGQNGYWELTVASGLLNDGNWHHHCLTRTGATIDYYIDGVLQTNITNNTLDAGAGSNTTIENIMANHLGSSNAAGKLSNVSLFNQKLTSTEVMKLYANGVPQDLSSFNPQPISWWTLGSNSFFNGSNYICRDLIGSNDGTSANAGVTAIVGDSPRSEANGTGTNMDVPSNLEGSTKYSSNNSWSINMSSTARVEDTP